MLKVSDHVSWNETRWSRKVPDETPMTGIVEAIHRDNAIVRPDGKNKQRKSLPLDKLTKIG